MLENVEFPRVKLVGGSEFVAQRFILPLSSFRSMVEIISPDRIEISVVPPDERVQRYKQTLEDSFPDSPVSIISIDHGIDISYNLLDVVYSGKNARDAKKVTCFLIRPDTELFKNFFKTLDPRAKEYVWFPTGIENVAEHEAKHFEAAKKILEGKGLVNQLGVNVNFLCCLRVLVYPDIREIDGRKFVIPISNVSTLCIYDNELSEDEGLAINLEIIVAAQKSKDGLSPSDMAQINQIISKRTNNTPILNGLLELLPHEERTAIVNSIVV